MPAVAEMDERFREAEHLARRFVGEGITRLQGASQFAIAYLATRSLADLRWGHYLAGEGYPVQMTSVVRPVIESMHLIDLFVAEPARAQTWVDGKHFELTPKKVRCARDGRGRTLLVAL